MRKRRWIETAPSNHLRKQEERGDIAIRDVMKFQDIAIDMGRIDAKGTAHIAMPKAFHKYEQTTSYQSNRLLSNTTVHGTHCLVLWLNQGFFDPKHAQHLYQHPTTDRAAYDRLGFRGDPTNYAGATVYSDVESMTQALSAKFSIPISHEWLIPDIASGHAAQATSSAILLMTTPEHEQTLLDDVLPFLEQQQLATKKQQHSASVS